MSMLLIESIRMDAGTQNRVAIDQETVRQYAEKMRTVLKEWPRVIVYSDGWER